MHLDTGRQEEETNATEEEKTEPETRTTDKETQKSKQIDGTYTGLDIFAKQSEGYPKEIFSLRSLTTGMLQGKIQMDLQLK